MFREIWRNKQLLSDSEIVKILKTRASGVLGASGDDDYPHTVPLSSVYKDKKLFFYCPGLQENRLAFFPLLDPYTGD